MNNPTRCLGSQARRIACFRESPRRQSGATLLEVLIAVVIMGVGMLGVAALQTTALRNSQSSLERSQAVIQSYAILDAMRANREAVLDGQYNTAGFVCTAAVGATHAQNDISSWINSMKETVGVGLDTTTCGNIACVAASGICTVSVQWDDSRAAEAGASGVEAGSATRQVQTVARL